MNLFNAGATIRGLVSNISFPVHIVTANGHSDQTLTIQTQTGDDFTFGGVLENGNRVLSLTKTGPGIQRIGGNQTSTNTGLVTVSGGTLSLEKSGGSNAILGDALVNGGILRWGVGHQVDNASNITINSGSLEVLSGGAFTDSIGSLTFNGGSIINDGQINVNNGGNALTMRGGTNLTNNFAIASNGTQTVRFDNTVTGSATISGASFILSGPNGGNTTKTFDIDDGTETVDMLITAPITQFAGVGSTTVHVNKTGAGTLNFANSVGYTGNTNILQGTLLLDGTHTVGGAYTVSSGATLGGDGSTTSAVTVLSGGTLAPGSSPGDLGTGNLSLNAGSTFAVDINGLVAGTDYDQVVVTGTVDITDSLLDITLGFSPQSGNMFTIIDNNLADLVTGTFNGLPEGAVFSDGGGLWKISYVGGTGNDVVLTAVPEPSAYLLGLLGIVGVVMIGRRRRR